MNHPRTPPEPTPETASPRFILWNHLHVEHKLTLIESELDEIIDKAVACVHPFSACAKAAWLQSTGKARTFSEACSMLAKRRRKNVPPAIPKNIRLPYSD